MRKTTKFAVAGVCLFGVQNTVHAATLPAHDPIDVVIISDGVNPNDLPPGELTEPGDIEAVLREPGNGITLARIREIASDCVDAAVAALQRMDTDVLIYFAHRSAQDCGGADAQAELTTAVRDFLRRGGGVVVFHHGIFTNPGKDAILTLLGGRANSLEWSTGAGQDVIGVAPTHFIVENGVEYSGVRSFGAADLGVRADDYPVFNNSPDERYPGLSVLTEAGESRTPLFASDYAGAQLLGYDLHRHDWAGHVVLYQPGEYQPNALDDLDGNNFQILANAIYYVATTHEEPMGPTGDTGADGGSDGDTASSTGGVGGGDGGRTTTDGDGGGTGDRVPGTDTAASAGGSTTGPGTDASSGGGCTCRHTDSGAIPALCWLILALRLRRD